jgi:ribosomal protein S18 acetylase RimI-like enzyme
MTEVRIRPARLDDDQALVALDHVTWSWAVAPVPQWSLDRRFFHEGTRPEDAIVATVAPGDAVAGYVKLGRSLPIESNAHVLQIQGLAVSPAHQGRGIGRLLLHAAEAEARARGVRRLTLRVLGSNPGAQALYASGGFVVEGVLKDEFLLDGRYTDDVLMAKALR